jgi:hypothetical protein
MKKHLAVVAFLGLFASLAWGAIQWTRVINLKVAGKTLLGTNTETNAVSKIVFGTQVAQFYTDGGLGCTLPQDAGVTSVIGAAVGDNCIVTRPALSHPGSAVDCSVLVADTAQLRHCAQQANVDAGPLTYRVMVISNQ